MPPDAAASKGQLAWELIATLGVTPGPDERKSPFGTDAVDNEVLDNWQQTITVLVGPHSDQGWSWSAGFGLTGSVHNNETPDGPPQDIMVDGFRLTGGPLYRTEHWQIALRPFFDIGQSDLVENAQIPMVLDVLLFEDEYDNVKAGTYLAGGLIVSISRIIGRTHLGLEASYSAFQADMRVSGGNLGDSRLSYRGDGPGLAFSFGWRF